MNRPFSASPHALPVACIRKSLNVKMNLAVVAILVVVLGASALATISMQNRQSIENTKNQAKILAQTVTSIIGIDMEGRCQKDVTKVIRMMGKFRDIETIRIFDAEGKILHSAEPSEVGKEVGDLVFNVFRSADRSKPFRSEERGHRSFCMVEVMANEPACYGCHDSTKEIVGVLEVCLSMAKTENQIAQNARFMLISTLGTLILVTLAISVLNTLMVKRPIQDLVRTMSAAQGGALDARVPVRKDDELGSLGHSFNSMISQLAATNTVVERLHREQMMRSERLASIGEMAASVAHEIKNPLAGLAGATQILAGSFGPGDSRYPVVQEMLKLTGRLDKTILDLLNFAKETEPKWRLTNLNDVVEETVFFAAKEGGPGGGSVHLELDPGLPDLEIDPEQLHQVVLNLVLNGRQAAGPTGTVTVATSSTPTKGCPGLLPDGWVELRVADDGPGIAPEVLSEIFKPFFTTKNHGTGLGLPISRKIVEAHGGVLLVDTAPGCGATFRVLLPLTRSGA